MGQYLIGNILEKHYYSGHNPHYTFVKVTEVHDEYLVCVKIGTRVVKSEDTQSKWKTVYAPDPNREIGGPFRIKLGYYNFGPGARMKDIPISWNSFMRRYEPWNDSSVNDTFTNSWAD
uniref:Uncharacterized protein n=1 Tax=uncultured bacterium fosmid pJB92C9 TaxID=1478074 RepID=A0A0H3UA33_9BACT|nr:hypothetical protein [uncultured bacterium fosmid pJB92C9]